MTTGVVVSRRANFYHVAMADVTIPCVLRGRFKKRGIRIYVGDRVAARITSPGEGVIEDVLPRSNLFLRPSVANIDQAVIVFCLDNPPANFTLVDRISVHAVYIGLSVVVCLNKADLETCQDVNATLEIYKNIGFTTIKTSAVAGKGLTALKNVLDGKTSLLAGQSGVGKSSLLNALNPMLNLETGGVSIKTGFGRHTTRHIELVRVGSSGFVADTPGFSDLEVGMIPKTNLARCFPEFNRYSPDCRFAGCLHRAEPSCGVRWAESEGLIQGSRYINYLRFLEEIEEHEQRRFR